MNPETQPEFGSQIPEEETGELTPPTEQELGMQASFYQNKIIETAGQGDEAALKTAAYQARGFVSYAEEHAQGRELIEVLLALLDQAEKVTPLDPESDDGKALKDLRERMNQHYREAA